MGGCKPSHREVTRLQNYPTSAQTGRNVCARLYYKTRQYNQLIPFFCTAKNVDHGNVRIHVQLNLYNETQSTAIQ